MHNFDTDPVAQTLRNTATNNLNGKKVSLVPSMPRKIIGFVALLTLAASTCLLAFCSAQTENEVLTQELTTCHANQ